MILKRLASCHIRNNVTYSQAEIGPPFFLRLEICNEFSVPEYVIIDSEMGWYNFMALKVLA